jgi:hypothetical protein
MKINLEQRMDVEITSEEVYMISINGEKRQHGWRVLSFWETFAKLSNAKGETIIIDGYRSDNLVENAFGGIPLAIKPRKVTIIKASPSVLAELNKLPNEPDRK